MTDANLTGFDVAVGSYEEAEEWVGRTSDTSFAHTPVNRSEVQFFASMVEDSNPAFWDEAFATEQWGGLCLPPGQLFALETRPLWRPEEDDDDDGSLVTDVPLPEGRDNILNVSTETTLDRPITEGTHVNWQKEIVDVTDEKELPVGVGNFVTLRTTYRNQRGEQLAERHDSMLRYEPHGDGGGPEYDSQLAEGRRLVETEAPHRERSRDESLALADVEAGQAVTPFEFGVSYRKVIHDVAATRDFYPVHHDPEFARDQGIESISLNTMAFEGLVDRLATDWAGADWRVVERSIQMKGSAVAGDAITVQGEVADVSPGDGTVEIEGGVYKGDHAVCPATVTIARD